MRASVIEAPHDLERTIRAIQMYSRCTSASIAVYDGMVGVVPLTNGGFFSPMVTLVCRFTYSK
jgi:hypothetical protein